MSDNNVITCAQKYWRLMRQYHKYKPADRVRFKPILECAAFVETRPYLYKRYLAKAA